MAADDSTNGEWGAWEAFHFRVTTFHRDDMTELSQDRGWEKVVGSKPTKIVSRPGESARYEGEYEGQELLLICRRDRVDWILQPIEDLANTSRMKPPTFLPIAQYLLLFQRIIEKWLANCPNINRLAFGANLMSEVDNRPMGYIKLSNYLPDVNLRGTDFTDFLYQINRPRHSKHFPEVTINRLIKWSVFQSQSISVSLGVSAEAKVDSTMPWFACLLELDINSSSDSNLEDKSDQMPLLFNELQNLGSEIAISGDVP